MKRIYIFSNLVWIVFTIAVMMGSYRLGLGEVHAPGSGFLTFYTAALLGILALISLIHAWKGPKEETSPVWRAKSLRKGGLLLIVLFFYVALFNILGFLLGTFLLLLFLFRVAAPLKRGTVLFASALTVFATYFLFDIVLGNKLPKGFLGF